MTYCDSDWSFDVDLWVVCQRQEPHERHRATIPGNGDVRATIEWGSDARGSDLTASEAEVGPEATHGAESASGGNNPNLGVFPGTNDGSMASWFGDCGCWTCVAHHQAKKPWPQSLQMPFIVCPDCGNKRCPKGTHHDNACTGSNEPGQDGSRY